MIKNFLIPTLPFNAECPQRIKPSETLLFFILILCLCIYSSNSDFAFRDFIVKKKCRFRNSNAKNVNSFSNYRSSTALNKFSATLNFRITLFSCFFLEFRLWKFFLFFTRISWFLTCKRSPANKQLMVVTATLLAGKCLNRNCKNTISSWRESVSEKTQA